jgi:hypothetical protein
VPVANEPGPHVLTANGVSEPRRLGDGPSRRDVARHRQHRLVVGIGTHPASLEGPGPRETLGPQFAASRPRPPGLRRCAPGVPLVGVTSRTLR